jgi:MFS family permease
VAVDPGDVRLLARPAFRRLLESRVLGHTGQSAMFYGVFILVLGDESSSFNTALLLTASLLPSIILGVPAGYLVDLAPKRLILTLGYLARAAIALALAIYNPDLTGILLLAAASSVAGQFLGAAEPATIPAVVPADRLGAGNSLMMIAHIIAQALGLVVLGPILVKRIDGDAAFYVAAVLCFAAAVVTGIFARNFTAHNVAPSPRTATVEAIRQEQDQFRYNRRAYLATVYLTVSVVLSKVLTVLLPTFTQDVLGIAPEDIVFVAVPAAIGAGLGILVTPPLTRLGAIRIATVAFFLALCGALSLGLVADVRDFIESNLDIGISFVEDEVGVSSVITVTMLLAIPIGLFFTITNIASRVVLNQEMPPRAQARTFAIQSVFADIASLIPVLAIGAVAEVAGAGTTMIVVTIGAISLSIYLVFFRGPREQRPVRAGALS